MMMEHTLDYLNSKKRNKIKREFIYFSFFRGFLFYLRSLRIVIVASPNSVRVF